jgi:DNA-binding MurR/RpiR family transcriptional regulator
MVEVPDVPDPYRARLDTKSATLSTAGRRVASYIDSNRVAVLASSALELAARTETSDATVIRTVQALGFSGLADLKQVLLASINLPATPADDMRRTLGEIGENTDRAIEAVIDAHDAAMAKLRSPQARARIAAAVSTLHPAARIAIFGIGPSAALAVYVATLLARGGRRTLTLNATGAMLADQMLELRKSDALLVLAYGRATGEVATVFAEARELGLSIVLVTDSLEDRLARLATVILPARRGRTGRVALHGATLVCLEALVLGLAAANPGTVPTLERLNRLRRDVRRNTHSPDPSP